MNNTGLDENCRMGNKDLQNANVNKEVQPSFKIALLVTPDVDNLSSKFEHCVVFHL